MDEMDEMNERDAISKRVERSLQRDDIRNAILTVGQAIVPDGQYDPADDPRLEQAISALGQLVEDMTFAEAVADALRTLWRQWVLEQAG